MYFEIIALAFIIIFIMNYNGNISANSNDGKTTFKTTAQNEQIQTIKEIFSNEVVSNLKPVLKTDALSGLKISGFVSTPDYTRSSKKDYYLYVNSRLVKCPVFQKSIDMVYKNLIGSRDPFVVLNLEIPPVDVDVNVHPTKKEVRYKNPNQIFNFIYSSRIRVQPFETHSIFCNFRSIFLLNSLYSKIYCFWSLNTILGSPLKAKLSNLRKGELTSCFITE